MGNLQQPRRPKLVDQEWWDQTLASYSQSPNQIPDVGMVPRAHLQWIADLPLMHVDQHRVFVHASVDPEVSLDRQSEQTLLWKKHPVGFALGHASRHVVHGHHANQKAPIVTRGRTNLDALAWKTGRMVVGVFQDDQPGSASAFLEINGVPG